MNNEMPTDEPIISPQASEGYKLGEYPELVTEHFKRHPDQVQSEALRDYELEAQRLLEMMDQFEAKHSLEELNAIVELTPKEAETHPVRRPAWREEIAIVDLIEKIRKETNIPKEEFDRLQARRKRISNAVGHIRNNRVEHDR